MVGIVGVVITNGVYDLLYWHHLLGPVTSTTVATVVATVVSYLANRHWSFRARQRTGVPREVAALNLGIVLATLFRFWSYRRFVWRASAGEQSGEAVPTEE